MSSSTKITDENEEEEGTIVMLIVLKGLQAWIGLRSDQRPHRQHAVDAALSNIGSNNPFSISYSYRTGSERGQIVPLAPDPNFRFQSTEITWMVGYLIRQVAFSTALAAG